MTARQQQMSTDVCERVDYVKETAAGHRFNVRFHSGGRLQEWPIDGDISEAWEGVFFAGEPEVHPWSMATVIGSSVTRYEQHPDEQALIGLEAPEPPAERSQCTLRPVGHDHAGLQWFQGRGTDRA